MPLCSDAIMASGCTDAHLLTISCVSLWHLICRRKVKWWKDGGRGGRGNGCKRIIFEFGLRLCTQTFLLSYSDKEAGWSAEDKKSWGLLPLLIAGNSIKCRAPWNALFGEGPCVCASEIHKMHHMPSKAQKFFPKVPEYLLCGRRSVGISFFFFFWSP